MGGIHQKNHFAVVVAEEEVAFEVAAGGVNVPSSVAAPTHPALSVAPCPSEVPYAPFLDQGQYLLTAPVMVLLPGVVADPSGKPGVVAFLPAPVTDAPVAVLLMQFQQIGKLMQAVAG
mgnify:CR=1 FL=1